MVCGERLCLSSIGYAGMGEECTERSRRLSSHASQVRVTAYDCHPAPASLFMRLVLDKEDPKLYANRGDDGDDGDGGAPSTAEGPQAVASRPPEPLSAGEAAAMADMLRLGPLLQTLLSLLGEPERGVDENAVTLLQQVISH